MNAVAELGSSQSLPALIAHAKAVLDAASTSAEVLEARNSASFAYDLAKSAARLAAARGAHSDLIAAARRAQADALEIEALADSRLADEYDAAQRSGRVRKAGQRIKAQFPPRADEVGINHKHIHKARELRDAISHSPRALRSVLDDLLKTGSEPTRALLRRELKAVQTGARPTTARAENQELRLICGRIVARVSWFELADLRCRAEREARFLTAIERHLANAEPDTRVGDALSAATLRHLFDEAAQ